MNHESSLAVLPVSPPKYARVFFFFLLFPNWVAPDFFFGQVPNRGSQIVVRGEKKKHQVIKFYSTHILQTKKQQLPRPLQKCHNHSPFTFFLLFFLGAGPSARPSPIWSSKQSKQAGKRRARAPPSRSSRVDMPHTSRESIQAKEQGKQAKKKSASAPPLLQ